MKHRAPRTEGLRTEAVKAVVWMGGFRVAQQVLDQAFTLVLVRLLVPGDFGLIAMAGVFTALLNVVSDMGLARAIVQRRDIDEEYASTAFWSNLAMGMILCLIAFAASSPVARLYGEPTVRPVFAALSIRFIFAGVSATQVAMLWRGLRARSLVTRNAAAITIGGLVGIGLAMAGAGVWALVAQSLVTFIGKSVLLWFATPWRPTARFSWEKFQDLWSFGSRILAARVFRYVIVQTDNLLIGTRLGAMSLGYYAFGYGMFLSPLIDLSHTIGQVSFATFSRLQEDLPKLRQAFLALSRYVTLFALPCLFGFFLIAPDLIALAFGVKWLPAVPVLRILLVAGILQIHTTLWQMVFQAFGRADLVLKWSFAAACLYVLAFLVGIRWGIVGVAASYAISTSVLMPVQLSIVHRLVGFDLADYLRDLLLLALATAVMGGFAWLAQFLMSGLGAATWIRLAVTIPVGVGTYTAVIMTMQRELVADMWHIALELRHPRLAKGTA